MPRPLALVIDLVLVLVFVLIGRASHDENPVAGALVTLWPFASGLGVGWLVARAWRHPLRLVPTGLVIWACTVAGGMLLRIVSGQGVQLSFVIVAAIVLAAFLVGWRAIALAVTRVSRRRASR